MKADKEFSTLVTTWTLRTAKSLKTRRRKRIKAPRSNMFDEEERDVSDELLIYTQRRILK